MLNKVFINVFSTSSMTTYCGLGRKKVKMENREECRDIFWQENISDMFVKDLEFFMQDRNLCYKI